MFPLLSLLSAGFWKQRRDVVSSVENAVSKSTLYSRTTDYIEGESPHLPKELDHSLGIAREEVCHKSFNPSSIFGPFITIFWLSTFFSQVVSKEKEVLEWKRKYEDSRQEVIEMRFVEFGFTLHHSKNPEQRFTTSLILWMGRCHKEPCVPTLPAITLALPIGLWHLNC